MLSVGPLDIAFIVLGAVAVVGFIAWRTWMGRKRQDEDQN